MSDSGADELRRLRLTMRDMVALSALPAVWGGLPLDAIARSLADILLRTLALDLVYVQMAQPHGEDGFEIGKTCAPQGSSSRECTIEARSALAPALAGGAQAVELPHPFAEGTLRATAVRFGLFADHGLVAAACSRPNFPTEQDRMLLAFAANQVAQLVQQRRAEQELRRSEQRFLEYTNAAPAILWATGEDGVRSFFSMGWSEFTGQTLSEGVHLGWLEALHPEDRDQVAEQFQAAHRAQCGLSIEYRVRRTDGVYTSVLDTSRSRMSFEGRFLGLVGNIVDISERKRYEAKQVQLLGAVEAERKMLADVFQQSPSFMCILSGPDCFFERVNEECRRLIDQRDVLGLPVSVALPEVVEQGLIEVLDHVYRTGKTYVGKAVPVRLRKSGREAPEMRYLDFVCQAIRSVEGAVAGIFVQGIDLTDRMQAEAVSKSEADRRTLLLSAAKHILEAPVADAALCQQVFEMIGGPLESDIFYVYQAGPEGLEMVASVGVPENWTAQGRRLSHADSLCGLVSSTKQPLVVNVHQTKLDGPGRLEREIGVRAFSCHPLFRRDRQLMGTFAVASSRKEEYSSSEVEFLQTVSHFLALAWDRYQAEDALREQERRKDVFLATLAHELRNPLAPIRTGLALFNRATSIAETQRAREIMERQVAHMVRLIDDLLEVSRITTGKIVLKTDHVDVREIVHAAVELSRPLIDDGQHQLVVSLPPDPLYLRADLTRMTQVIGNLLNNSAKYSPPGGRIEVSAVEEAEMAVIRVQDNGTGLAREDLPEVFELFSQVRNRHDHPQSGLGIGLALVKRLVEMHGGAVVGSSQGLGLGCTFTVSLPLAQRQERKVPALRPATLASATPLPARKILVVDDNEDAAETLSLLLTSLGHVVHVAHSGPEALEIVEAFGPETVFLDIGLPSMDGYEVARRLRAMTGLRDLTIIALTGWGTSEDQQRAWKAGFDHHITKPFQLEDMDRLLRSTSMRQPLSRTAR